jgi:MFS family permease
VASKASTSAHTTQPALLPAPLWAVLSFTFVGSVGTAVATVGVPFLAQSAYGYGETEVLLLALLYGAVYIPGALGVGPALRRLAARHAWLTSGRLLAGISIVLGLLAVLPLLTRPAAEAGAMGAWAIWLMMAAQGVLSGATWPIVESYLSGGRRGESLRHAAGMFNITWGGCIVVSLAALGPFVKHHPLEALAAMLPVYGVCALLTRWMGPEPARSLPDAHPTRPARYKKLLRVFRVQLPMSFLLVAILEPVSPFLLASVAIEDPWRAPAAAIWLATRVATFALLARWHGWHGRWSMPVVAAVLLLMGFAGITIGPNLDALPAARALVLAGLAITGLGVGMIYTAAFYYAMEVGDAEIDAGGKHEAFIGLGYLGGPVVGLIAYGAAQPHGPLSVTPSLLLLVIAGAIVVVLGLGSVVWAVASGRRDRDEEHPEGL